MLIYLCLLYQISRSFFNICKSFPSRVAKIPIPSYPSAYSRSVWSTYEHTWYVTIGGLVTPNEDCGQHWFRQWIINWLLLDMNRLSSLDGTKPLLDPLLTYHQWCIVAFTWGAISHEMPKKSILDITTPARGQWAKLYKKVYVVACQIIMDLLVHADLLRHHCCCWYPCTK